MYLYESLTSYMKIRAVNTMARMYGRAIFALYLIAGLCSPSMAATVERMETNGRTNPLGISADMVSFSWALHTNERDIAQVAYQIRVGTHAGASDLWQSGRVESEQQVGVPLPPNIRLASKTRYFWQVRAWDNHRVAAAWSSPGWFETGLLVPSDWRGATWIAAPPAMETLTDHCDSLPLLRNTFFLQRHAIRAARLYVSARGIYEVRLNGRKVGNQFLSPGWTDYHHRIQVQTFDVGTLLAVGRNAIGVALADGWFRGKVGLGWKGV